MSKAEEGTEMEKAELVQVSVKNLKWFRDNYDEIQKKYDKQWVVIDNKRVVANCSTYDEILKAKLAEKKTALVEFIDSEQIAMFF
jgi:thymidylate kinase